MRVKLLIPKNVFFSFNVACLVMYTCLEKHLRSEAIFFSFFFLMHSYATVTNDTKGKSQPSFNSLQVGSHTQN